MDFIFLYYAVQLLAGFVIFVTIWGLLHLDNWWVRAVEFPRLQILALGASAWLGLLLSGSLFSESEWQIKEWALFAALGA